MEKVTDAELQNAFFRFLEQMSLEGTMCPADGIVRGILTLLDPKNYRGALPSMEFEWHVQGKMDEAVRHGILEFNEAEATPRGGPKTAAEEEATHKRYVTLPGAKEKTAAWEREARG